VALSLRDTAYWDTVAAGLPAGPAPLWRDHSDAVNADLLERWLPARLGRVLKTDLFDEVVGRGLVVPLRRRAGEVVGIDVSPRLVETAGRRHPALTTLMADVRALPLADSSFDAVISNSTLDHLASLEEVSAALRELYRVLRPGGRLVLTLDNPVNPVLALRSALSPELRRRLRVAPYPVGATCGPRRASRLVRDAGFDVLEIDGIMHFPRIVGVLAEGVVRRRGAARRRLLRLALDCESLRRLPTRYLTAYFVAVNAVKPA
jgi:SAM-dependent methyltransferase